MMESNRPSTTTLRLNLRLTLRLTLRNNPPREDEEEVRVQWREAVERHLARERLEQRPNRDGDMAGENVPQVGDDGGVELGLGEVLEEGEEEGLQSVLKALKPSKPYNGWCIMVDQLYQLFPVSIFQASLISTIKA
jgi:hypothetical protein